MFLVEAAALKHFSDDMGPLLVDGQLTDEALQGLLDEALLLVHSHVVENSLDGVCALLVAADANKIVFD